MNRPVPARAQTVKASLLAWFTGCQTLKRYRDLARCRSALDRSLAAWVFTPSPPFIVRPTASGYNNVCRHLGYLCVRLLSFPRITELRWKLLKQRDFYKRQVSARTAGLLSARNRSTMDINVRKRTRAMRFALWLKRCSSESCRQIFLARRLHE
jgi:hypothetical protein